ncbi:MAG TPA: Arc family DNA-binding protein [Ktedonobacterales bacterium]|nr:Arc family DNA-binding protein [Ktedonobacterales bacterium]
MARWRVMVPLLCYNSTMKTKALITHINVRFPADLIEELRRSARENERSLHGEILWILREYVARRKRERGEA